MSTVPKLDYGGQRDKAPLLSSPFRGFSGNAGGFGSSASNQVKSVTQLRNEISTTASQHFAAAADIGTRRYNAVSLGNLFRSSAIGERQSGQQATVEGSPAPRVVDPNGSISVQRWPSQRPLPALTMEPVLRSVSGSSVGTSDMDLVDHDSNTSHSTATLPPLPSDEAPVVPMEVLSHCPRPWSWQGSPAAPVVLSLLNTRGIFLPQHKDLVSYHMAPSFLYSLTHLMFGSYFVKYGLKHSAPKERYFSVRLMPNSGGVEVPWLTWTIHQHGAQLVDKVPLSQLVGVHKGTEDPAFRRYLITPQLIRGCRQGPHHAKLPTNGAITLFFYDKKKHVARSLSLLTCSNSVFQLWTATLEGIVSVNSSCLRQVGFSTGLGNDEISELMRRAQHQLAHAADDEYADDDDEMGEMMAA